MKNTQQDRFEKKLIRFINDVDKGWKKYRSADSNLTDYLNYRDEKMKEYGLKGIYFENIYDPIGLQITEEEVNHKVWE
jgi:uncharacterized membrane protein YkvA (DUF1232 family)